jgi:hypothetical protein
MPEPAGRPATRGVLLELVTFLLEAQVAELSQFLDRFGF